MPRYVKCQVCSETVPYIERHTLAVERKDARNKYFHHECYVKYLKYKEFKKQEGIQLNQLEEVIKQIHGLKKVPSSFFSALQDVRNGTERYRNVKQYNYKKGATYPEIARAYELSKSDIIRIKQQKLFKDDNAELRYCLHVVLGRINQATAQLLREERQQAIQLFEDAYGDIGEDRPLPSRKIVE